MPKASTLNYSTVNGRAIRLPRVCDLTAQSGPTVWRRARNDPSFPKPFSLSPKITVWDEAEVLAWLQAKKSKRGAA